MKTIEQPHPDVLRYRVQDLACKRCGTPIQFIGEKPYCRCNDHEAHVDAIAGRVAVVRNLASVDPSAEEMEGAYQAIRAVRKMVNPCPNLPQHAHDESEDQDEDPRAFGDFQRGVSTLNRAVLIGCAVLLGLAVVIASGWGHGLRAWFMGAFKP